MPKITSVTELINKICRTNAIGVEIGVFQGSMSKAILEKCSISHLYLIDPYIEGYAKFREGTDAKQKHMNKRFKSVSSFFTKHYPQQTTLIRKMSENACDDVPDNLDFIYIDGNHAYEYVLRDLQLWVPKVKPGGVVIGDDWFRRFPGVITAVQEFCTNSNLLELPCKDYKVFKFSQTHVLAPGKGKAVVNKCQHTWWSIRNSVI